MGMEINRTILDRLILFELCVKYTLCFKCTTKTLRTPLLDPVPKLTHAENLLLLAWWLLQAPEPCRVAALLCRAQWERGPSTTTQGCCRSAPAHMHCCPAQGYRGHRGNLSRDCKKQQPKDAESTCFQVTEKNINALTWKLGQSHPLSLNSLLYLPRPSLQTAALLCHWVLALTGSQEKRASRFLVICLNVGFKPSIYLCHCQHLA